MFFKEQYKKLPGYRERLAELEMTNSVRNIPERIKAGLEKSILELKNEISQIETNKDLNFYISETTELIEKYKVLLKIPQKLSFTGKNSIESCEKRDVISKYLEIAQKYSFDNKVASVKRKEKKFRMICDNCPNKKDFTIEENSYICSDCGSQQDLIQNTSSYKDVDRVNISAKYTYDRKVHFRDCINQYQGKQNCSIDQKIYDDLEDIFERHHLLIGNKDTNKEVRFSKITKDHILMFLKELGYSKHYENVILIHYNITGKKPDDISHLEDKLLGDFDLLVETYDRLFKNKVDRVNFISTQYVLYRLLQKYKHPCKKEDFVILKTIERKSFHENTIEILFTELSWSLPTS
jgi:Zn finger protein HypA/HybF involved in hydrogenase expression